MRERMKQILEWMHATMLFLPVIPVCYMYVDIQGEENSILLLLKGLLIAIPVVGTGIAVKSCRFLITYLLSSLLLSGITVGLAGLVQPSEMGSLYVGLMAIESIVVVINRLVTRIKKAREKKEEKRNPYWRPTVSILDKPTFGTLAYFAILYFIGIFFASKDTCDELFFIALVYIFLVYVYVFLSETQAYLKINKQVSGLPVRRIYGIAGGMFGIFLILVFVAAVPSVLTIPSRQYVDIRGWLSMEVATSMDSASARPQDNSNMQQDSMEELLEALGGVKELPKWVEYLMNAIIYACIALVIWLILRAILKVFSDFRENMDENGDRIEQLGDDEAVTFIKAGNSVEEPETRNVRKKYRRMIRKHRKDRPAAYESPREIEEKAGLLQNGEMQKLHREYEAVRYGKKDCSS